MFLDKAMRDVPWTELVRLAEPSPTTTSKFLDMTAAQPQTPLLIHASNITSFSLFPSLPSEIRQHIFRLSLPPRVLTIMYDSQGDLFTTSTPPPVLLRVSHEARFAALQVYKLSFSTLSAQPRIYFNPYLDTLYLPRHGDMGYDESLRDFKKIVTDTSGLLDDLKRVAIDHVDVDIKRPWEGYNKSSFLREFKQLEEVVLVHDDIGRQTATSSRDSKVSWFVSPNLDPEQQLQMWWYFLQGFAVEENLLAEICVEMGRDYEAFKLPTVTIRGKEMS